MSQDRPFVSILMPAYNEAATIREVIARVRATPYAKEIVVVDDCSTDGTSDILRELEGLPSAASAKEGDDLKVIRHARNMGKGAAIRSAQPHLRGEITIIQDADLEYDPADYGALLQPLLDGRADVVYGSRFMGEAHDARLASGGGRRVPNITRRTAGHGHVSWLRMGNALLTFMSNMLTNMSLTDMETGYKAMRTDAFKRIRIKANRFGIEPELTVKLAKMRLRIWETPISYRGRSYSEGKKITWRDGVAAVCHIVRFRFLDAGDSHRHRSIVGRGNSRPITAAVPIAAQSALIVLPTYNERENLPLLVAELLKAAPTADILVVDDNSPDGTGKLADDLAGKHTRVKALHRSGKLGLGSAYLDGFAFGLREGYDLLMSMDCDFSHNPRYVTAMIERARSADLVIGSRYTSGGGTKGWGLRRKLISRTANTLMRLLLGLRTHDTSAGFRCYRRSALETIGLRNVQSRGYNVLEEMTYLTEKAGLRVAELPIIFTDRRMGATKVSFKDMVGVGTLLLRMLAKRVLG